MNHKKIKVIVLTSSFPRSEKDWWAQFILNIYKNLPKNKYNITVFAPHSPGSRFREQYDDVTVIRYPYFIPYRFEKLTSGEGVLHNKGDVLSKLQVISLLACQFIFLSVHLYKHKYDVIHAHWILPQGFFALCMSYIYSIPFVVTVHGSDVFGLEKFNSIKAIVLKKADACTVNSKATYDAVHAIYSRANIKLIPMGIDTKVFFLNRKAKKNGKTILAVGRLIQCKGYIYLLKALPMMLKSIPGLHLFIVGAGPEESILREFVNQLHLNNNVTFCGNLGHIELAKMYATSDVFIAPAVTDKVTGEREGQGLAIIEAMASGIPVIASKSGGIQYILENNKTGILTPERDYKAIAKETVFVLKNKKASMGISAAAVDEVKKKYTWGKIAESFDMLFDTITTL